MQSHRPLPDRQGDLACATHDLVAPLASKATAMRNTDMGGRHTTRRSSRAVSPVIGGRLRWSDLDSANIRSTLRTATTPGIRTSTTATRTTGTRTTSSERASSANHVPADWAEPSFTELVAAYFDCRKHKRNSASALAFEENLERNLCRLYEALLDGSYRPGRSICFVITEPKPREVWAAEFRDRIVHHLLYNCVSPPFLRAFIADSCACIPGRGTLYAAQRLEEKVRSVTQNWSRPAFYLKVDIANFFVSIDKPIVSELLARRIPAGWWRDLSNLLLFNDPRENVEVRGDASRLALIPPHKSLFRQTANKGLPIGNLPSQFCANVYLNELDQFAKHQIGARHYIRYVDDIVLLHESASWLNEARRQMERLLDERLLLKLNPSKTVLQPINRGIDFVGQEIRPWHRRIRRRSFHRAVHRLNKISDSEFFATANSYFGLMRQATHSHGDRVRLAKIAFARGRCVDHQISKTFRRHPKKRNVVRKIRAFHKQEGTYVDSN